MSRPSAPASPLLWVVSLVGVFGLGLVLRVVLAGFPLPVGSFAALRSAHSHLAWYGLLFPLVWWSAPSAGAPPWAQWTYRGAVLASTLAFAHSGYNLVSIVGSTVVLVGWLARALPAAPLLAQRSWAGLAPPAVLGAALAIPAVAVLSRRGDPLATPMVHGFLSWLLLGVALPAALRRLGVPAPWGLPAAVLVLLSGLALGPWPHPVARAGLCTLGLALIWFAPRASAASWPERAALVGLGLGLSLLATGWLPAGGLVSLAGLHFAALGPVLFTLAWPGDRARDSVPYLSAVSLLALAMAGPALWPHPAWPVLALLAAVLVISAWLLTALSVLLLPSHETPSVLSEAP